jgi:hypothetical protein
MVGLAAPPVGCIAASSHSRSHSYTISVWPSASAHTSAWALMPFDKGDRLRH